MGQQKKSKAPISNASSAANPAAASATRTATQSSILRSSFSPHHFRFSLFASVIQSFDSQHLRIHDTTSGRLRCEHAIAPKASINCLDWGLRGQGRHHKELKRKRKRQELRDGSTLTAPDQDVVVAFGTSDSEIQIFSPTNAAIVATLEGAHAQGVRDFKFAEGYGYQEGWSIGGDGKLVQWNLKSCQAVRTIVLPGGPANTLLPLTSAVICASRQAYMIDPETKTSPPSFSASTNPVHTIFRSKIRSSKGTVFLTAARNDFVVNVFNTDSPTLVGSLCAEAEILSLDAYSGNEDSSERSSAGDVSVRLLHPQQALAVVNKDGTLEIFPEPFEFGASPPQKGSESLKARMQQRTRKAAAQVRVTRPDRTSTSVPLLNASFQGNRIALAWVEGGVNLMFDMLQWRSEDTGNLLLKPITNIVKARSGAGIGAATVNGVKDVVRAHVDDSTTVVASGGITQDVLAEGEQREVIDISSGEEDSEFEEDGAPVRSTVQRKEDEQAREEDEDITMEDVDGVKEPELHNEAAGDDIVRTTEVDEPSFGDLIRANAPEAVDIQNTYTDPSAQSLVPTGEQGLQQLPSGMSLGAVLTQSLRTNDINLLETCFHVKDLTTIRATIERLESAFAMSLLQRLADRLHSRPGRAGSLMVWVQWTLVAHGGYLASQPEVMKKLSSLHRVVKDRAKSLQSLLALKGKLDMLEAQMNLRKSILGRSRPTTMDDEDDEEGVIYVEGQDESGSEEEDNEGETATRSRPSDAGMQESEDHEKYENFGNADSEVEEGEDEMPTITNGIVADLEEDSDAESRDEGLFDDEASSTDHVLFDENSADAIDHDSIDTSSSDADASPFPKIPMKPKLTNGLKSKNG